MKWQFIDSNTNLPADVPIFDDGVVGPAPGEEGFTTEFVEAKGAELGFTQWDYMGKSWPPVEEPQQ